MWLVRQSQSRTPSFMQPVFVYAASSWMPCFSLLLVSLAYRPGLRLRPSLHDAICALAQVHSISPSPPRLHLMQEVPLLQDT